MTSKTIEYVRKIAQEDVEALDENGDPVHYVIKAMATVGKNVVELVLI